MDHPLPHLRAIRLTVFGIFSYLLIVQLVVFVLGLRRGSQGAADFRHLYTAGYMVRAGQGADVYRYDLESALQDRIVNPGITVPFDHLAYEALLFVPLSYLKYSTAYFVFAGFNVLLLFATQRGFRPYLSPLEALGRFAPEAVFFGFLPVAVAIVLGQDSILLLALAVWAFVALDRGHEMRSGLLLSLGFFKFQYILPIILLFVLWRKWRFVLGATVGGLGTIGLSVRITGLSGLRAFVRTIGEMSVGLNGAAQRVKFATFPRAMPNLRGLIDTVGSPHFSSSAIQWAVAVCSILVILFASRMRPSLPLAILASVLVSYHCFIHDSALLVLPLGLLLVKSVFTNSLPLGAFVISIFAVPEALFQFFEGRYYPMAILLLALLMVQRRSERRAAASSFAKQPST
jgi:hypothetical protein